MEMGHLDSLLSNSRWLDVGYNYLVFLSNQGLQDFDPRKSRQ